MTADPYLARSLGFLLADVSRLVRERFDARASELGLTRAQWRVLAQLRRRAGITQTALADILEIEQITLGRHIDRLVEKGFVERRPDPQDRRAWNLYLEAKVQPVLDRLREHSTATSREALAGIAREDADKLIDLLLAMKANMLALEPIEAKPVTRFEAKSEIKSEIKSETLPGDAAETQSTPKRGRRRHAASSV